MVVVVWTIGGVIHGMADQCKVWRDPLSHHCFDCNACVSELDHHCPWTSKCVGRTNLRVFYCFVSFVQALFCYALVIIIIYVARRA